MSAVQVQTIFEAKIYDRNFESSNHRVVLNYIEFVYATCCVLSFRFKTTLFSLRHDIRK